MTSGGEAGDLQGGRRIPLPGDAAGGVRWKDLENLEARKPSPMCSATCSSRAAGAAWPSGRSVEARLGPTPRHVRRQHRTRRAAPPRLRDRLQLGGRGPRRVLQEHHASSSTWTAPCSVADDGRGIPVGIKADTGKSTLEEALTIAGTSRQVRQRRLPRVRRAARHGREGDERALASGARPRSAATGGCTRWSSSGATPPAG